MQSLVENQAPGVNAWVILLPDGPTWIRDGTEIEKKELLPKGPSHAGIKGWDMLSEEGLDWLHDECEQAGEPQWAPVTWEGRTRGEWFQGSVNVPQLLWPPLMVAQRGKQLAIIVCKHPFSYMEEMGISWVSLLPKYLGVAFINKMLVSYWEVLSANLLSNMYSNILGKGIWA